MTWTLVRLPRWYPALLVIAGAVFPAPAFRQAPPKGHLFIVGGGDAPPELAARFVALAAGPGHARIAVVPMTSGEPEATGQEKVAELKGSARMQSSSTSTVAVRAIPPPPRGSRTCPEFGSREVTKAG